MRTLSYVSGATGESIGFEGPLYGGTLTGLRARIWDYSLASRGITGITRKTRETTIPVKIHDSPETLDLLRRLADADMASGEPGTLIADGEWKAGAWITKSEPQSITPTMVETQLTIVLADGVWRRSTMTHFTPRYDSGTSDWTIRMIIRMISPAWHWARKSSTTHPSRSRSNSRYSDHARNRTSSSETTGTRST